MTTIDPFTTPAEAERADRTRQARDFLALAMAPEHLVTHDWDFKHYQLDYGNGLQAMRDAMVGQGYALVAVQAELADIAASLRTLASAPNALAEIGREITDLTATVDQGVEFADSTAHAAGLVVTAVHELVEVMDRPRWWQWRRRRALGQADASPACVPQQQEDAPSEMYEFRVDLRGTNHKDALASARFHAEWPAARDIASKMLPDLCAEAGAPADPDQVYGRIFRADSAGEFFHVDSAFLHSATTTTDRPT